MNRDPSLCGTRSHLAFTTLPLPIPSIAFLKLTASSRLSAPPSAGVSNSFGGQIYLEAKLQDISQQATLFLGTTKCTNYYK